MGRFTRENEYDGYVHAEANAQGVPVALVKAIIGAESSYVATAKRPEPQINDASWGLMQLLYRTAQGLGYSGDPSGLLDPSTNIHYGVTLLAQLLARTGGDLDATISAYNGGYRPTLGFGRKATKPLSVCLAHDPRTGVCIKTHNTPVGEFSNQDYVNRVLSHYRYFLSLSSQPKGPAAPPPIETGESGPIMASIATVLGGKFTLPLLFLALGGLLWARGKQR